MTIHFICRGNAFRSIIAEAYLNSLELEEMNARSSGTVAAKYRENNRENHRVVREFLEKKGLGSFIKSDFGEQLTQESLNSSNDIAICMNEIVCQEAKEIVDLPENTIVWNVADGGEEEPQPETPEEEQKFIEKTYQNIRTQVDGLVKDLQSSL